MNLLKSNLFFFFAYILLVKYMQKDTLSSSINNYISINERKNITLSGVKKIESFDNEEFLLDTTLGMLLIKGQELEMIKLDTIEGKVAIKGQINSLDYLDGKDSNKNGGFFTRLFK